MFDLCGIARSSSAALRELHAASLQPTLQPTLGHRSERSAIHTLPKNIPNIPLAASQGWTAWCRVAESRSSGVVVVVVVEL